MKLPVNYDSLTPGQRFRVKEEYVLQQKGLCWYCQLPLTERPSNEVEGSWIDRDLFPPGFLDAPVHLHHDHATGLTIGAVHARCNGYLWQYKRQ